LDECAFGRCDGEVFDRLIGESILDVTLNDRYRIVMRQARIASRPPTRRAFEVILPLTR